MQQVYMLFLLQKLFIYNYIEIVCGEEVTCISCLLVHVKAEIFTVELRNNFHLSPFLSCSLSVAICGDLSHDSQSMTW